MNNKNNWNQSDDQFGASGGESRNPQSQSSGLGNIAKQLLMMDPGTSTDDVPDMSTTPSTEATTLQELPGTGSGKIPRFADALKSIDERSPSLGGNKESNGQPMATANLMATVRCKLYETVGSKEELDKSLKVLNQLATQLVSQAQEVYSQELVDSAELSLLRILRRTTGVQLSKVELSQLQMAFGSLDKSLVNKAMRTVHEMKVNVGVDEMRSIITEYTSGFSPIIPPNIKKRKKDKDDLSKREKKKEKERKTEGLKTFGNFTKVNMPNPSKKINFEKLAQDLIVYVDAFKDVDDFKSGGEAAPIPSWTSMMAPPNMDFPDPDSQEPMDIGERRYELSLTSLVQDLSEQFPDVDSVLTSLFASLVSEKATDEIQAELLDLLGFERFDLLTEVLQNRRKLVQQYRERQERPRQAQSISSSANGALETGPSMFGGARPKTRAPPSYGQHITVQSETEQKLAKAYRKEEKRQEKQKQKFGPIFEDEMPPEELYNVDELRKMELEWEAAQSEPILTKTVAAMNVAVAQHWAKYPYVFDASLQPGNVRTVVGSEKIVLPENTVRKSKKDYDEVIVPPYSGPPVNIGKDKIKIANMDEISQKAFQGTKTLNQIQTVVYEQASKTNENLLICAPTGAGKTNIAMLCVLRVIKKNMVNGVIQKDKFKIIYIAPMKALAGEMVRNFGKRLNTLGVVVRECTGDIQLTKREIGETQMIVTTPEKWDVITRKSTGDVELVQKVKLLIIDEIHLLHDDRGPVIETIVARTLRQVEQRQHMIRIVGLSATLPNYVDVSRFLHVNPEKGLFFFDGRFRPVPLCQIFIGVKKGTGNAFQQLQAMDMVCYEKVRDFVRDGHQVLVFVHARNATGKIATVMKELASNKGDSLAFTPEDSKSYGSAQSAVMKSRNRQLKELFPAGFGIHHAGMLRVDRNLVERLFADGHIKVLCCTATLAWGVNLPAHAVIIRGTEIYDAKHGSFVDLGILDVQQIFGRAGRPQYDTKGEGIIITSHDKIAKYLSLMTRQHPIESQFMNMLVDNLNAEIVLGTVSNVEEAIEWLSYTYLYVRVLINPLVYGQTAKKREEDPDLYNFRRDLIDAAARKLAQYQMVKYDTTNGSFMSTDFGRIASHFYVKCDTIEMLLKGDGAAKFTPVLPHNKIFELISKASEFNQLKVRDDELEELDNLIRDSCHVPVAGGPENLFGKVNVLLQAHISKQYINSFSLVSDSNYCVQNASRITRALFEISLRNSSANSTTNLLQISKSLDKQLWPNEHALWQLVPRKLTMDDVSKLEQRHLSLEFLRETPGKEISGMVRLNGERVRSCAWMIPWLEIDASVRPITNTVLRINLNIRGDFKWEDSVHGRGMEPFWIWVENPNDNFIYHYEYFLLHAKQVKNEEVQDLSFAIPIIGEALPTHYLVRWISDRWVGSESHIPISFNNIQLPDPHRPHTDLLTLRPLSLSALGDERLQSIFKFQYFNPVQTQIFHTLYHSDTNALVGAPTGSGKTVAAELAIFRVFREYPGKKCVYIAPMKALVRERIRDWTQRLGRTVGKKVVELTGDFTPDVEAIRTSDVIVTTPEKWDGISRNWQNRAYVTQVALIVIDEIHLLGEDRGPVLEVIVARTNFISSRTGQKVRVVGLSTALANAGDVASWLGIDEAGMFNFRPSVRPVPTEVHISGFAGKNYCPRMSTMNKPAFIAIREHSPEKPVLIFVSSRRQTRLTALDMIALLAAEPNPRRWLHMDPMQMDMIVSSIRDQSLKLFLSFGIAIHHAGLHQEDRNKVEELFVNQKIQVLIATATLAWGVNFPAHLVIIKGTEVFDGKTKRYVDMPVTDVLQMVGRAGRPQFDDQGVAVVYVQDTKKSFYKKFLYEPFPVESNLLSVLADHLNAEIVAGTVSSKSEAANYLTWTYLFRRLLKNPSYYNMDIGDEKAVNRFVTEIVDNNLYELEQAGCVQVMEDNRTLKACVMGKVASFYYLNYRTVQMLRERLTPVASTEELLKLLSDVREYDEVPVRHNEDETNRELAQSCPIPVEEHTYDDPHTKTHLLYQVHFSRIPVPISDYDTDRKSIIDQSVRILQAMLDSAGESGWLGTCLRIVQLIQMVYQGRWHYDPPLSTLPHIQPHMARAFRGPCETLPELQEACERNRSFLLKNTQGMLTPQEVSDVEDVLKELPKLRTRVGMRGWWEGGEREETRPVTLLQQHGKTAHWMQVHADQDYLISINLSRLNRRSDKRAKTPRYHKFKEEGWIIILGDGNTGELVALKRVGAVDAERNCHVKLNFSTPESPGHVIYQLYILSDCYLGLDEQYDIPLEVTAESLQAIINTEVAMESSTK